MLKEKKVGKICVFMFVLYAPRPAKVGELNASRNNHGCGECGQVMTGNSF